MTSVLFMGGLFNVIDPVLGWTLYMWSWIALIILIGIAWAFWYYRGWKPFEPLHGLYYAMKNGSTVAFIFDATLVGEMVAERDAKCIFRYADDEYEIEIPDIRIPILRNLIVWYKTKIFYYPTKYLDISPLKAIVYKIAGVNKDVEIARLLEGGVWERSASVVCSGVPVDIVIDMDNWTIKNSRQHKAIVASAKMWNELNPTDQIHSYRKYAEYLKKENGIPTPPELTPQVIVPWQRIDAAFPLDLDENEWAGKKRQMAKDMEDEESGIMNRLSIYLLCGELGIAALLLIVRLVAPLIK